MNLIGQRITLEWFAYDADGNLQNYDATPTVTITGPGGAVDATTTNVSTGRYRTTFDAAQAGAYVAELEGLLDAAPEYAVQRRIIHDGVAEAQRAGFPEGLSSWESAVT